MLISEIAGPASPPRSPTAPEARSRTPWSLKGQIVVDRRRVTKDGRVKLKLSLLGVMVDRCGICLSQFKEKERGILGECRHVYVSS